jgi:hypothetical protein
MILNRSHFLFAIVVVTIAMVSASCVEIPDKAPDPPALNAEFRFVSILPSGSANELQIDIADGPNFSSYKNYDIPAFGTPSTYLKFLSGSKRIAYGATDTFRLTFDTDQRGVVTFYEKKNGTFDALKMVNRYTFAANGLVDTALVRFTNLVLKAQDTIDVYRSDSTLASGVVSSNNILFAGTSAVVKIPVGKSYKFFFTDPSSQNRVYRDSIIISGASRKVYSVYVYDKFDSTAVGANRTAAVQVKVLEEL